MQAYIQQTTNHKSISNRLTHLLPTTGNIIFTVLMIAVTLWAQSAGAMMEPSTNVVAVSSTNSACTIPYQGYLTDKDEKPLTGTHDVSFSLYSQASGGTALWHEEWAGSSGVQIENGLFNVILGSRTPLENALVINADSLFLGIKISGIELNPRTQLGNSFCTGSLAQGILRLLGVKDCRNCPNVVEENLIHWTAFKGENVNDLMEVTATTNGGNIHVHMTGRYQTNLDVRHWCGVGIYQAGRKLSHVHLEGNQNSSRDRGCSGSYVLTDLPAGTYTFRAEGWTNINSNVTWYLQRQIAVYESLP